MDARRGFLGWPSSHAAIAFAMAATVFTLCPKQRWLGWVAILYACYVGLGVSMTIHWFSDFAPERLLARSSETWLGNVIRKHRTSNAHQSSLRFAPARHPTSNNLHSSGRTIFDVQRSGWMFDVPDLLQR